MASQVNCIDDLMILDHFTPQIGTFWPRRQTFLWFCMQCGVTQNACTWKSACNPILMHAVKPCYPTCMHHVEVHATDLRYQSTRCLFGACTPHVCLDPYKLVPTKLTVGACMMWVVHMPFRFLNETECIVISNVSSADRKTKLTLMLTVHWNIPIVIWSCIYQKTQKEL